MARTAAPIDAAGIAEVGEASSGTSANSASQRLETQQALTVMASRRVALPRERAVLSARSVEQQCRLDDVVGQILPVAIEHDFEIPSFRVGRRPNRTHRFRAVQRSRIVQAKALSPRRS